MKEATLADVTDVEEAAARPAQPLMVPQRTALATTSASLMTIIEVCISRPDFDIDKVQRLLDVKERWEAIEASKAFVEAMAAFKREPVEIFKRKQVGYNTKDGDFVGYKHAELSDVTDAIAPAMARHGLSFDWDIHQGSGLITVDCVVTHVLGHSKKVTMSGAPDSSGKKNQIQQVASTITYLQRYTLLAVTGMSTKGEDDDGGGGTDDGDDQKGTNTPAANTTRAAASTQQSDRPMYDQAKFDANAAEWKVVITSGRKTPAQLIALIETKGATLTGEQRDTIDSWSQK
jgi:hypothetical protein